MRLLEYKGLNKTQRESDRCLYLRTCDAQKKGIMYNLLRSSNSPRMLQTSPCSRQARQKSSQEIMSPWNACREYGKVTTTPTRRTSHRKSLSFDGHVLWPRGDLNLQLRGPHHPLIVIRILDLVLGCSRIPACDDTLSPLRAVVTHP